MRYGAVGEPVTHQLRYELQVIGQAGLANYLLIVWDLVRFARSQGIRCQGRGSAANSLVAYLLGIGPIDPLRHQPVFERFLSAERPTLPGIDLGVDAARPTRGLTRLATRPMAARCSAPRPPVTRCPAPARSRRKHRERVPMP